jgi:hypothetical protein
MLDVVPLAVAGLPVGGNGKGIACEEQQDGDGQGYQEDLTASHTTLLGGIYQLL